MATTHFRNAKILVAGYDISGDSNTINVEFSAEMLDETSFGDSTRIRKGGLTIGNINGGGFVDGTAGHVDVVAFSLVGVDDSVIFVFANGITEGSLTDMGFAMKGVVEKYDLNGDVGSLLGFDLSAMGRGIL